MYPYTIKLTGKSKEENRQFLYGLYKAYESVYGSDINAKRKILKRIESVTHINRTSIARFIQKNKRDPNASSARQDATKVQRWATGLIDEQVQQIEDRIHSLCQASDSQVPMRKLHLELCTEGLFNGSFGSLHKLLVQMGYAYVRDEKEPKWRLLKKKIPTDEQVNSNQRHFPQFSNMMEVKHSPASKMEFRSNGLPANEVDDIDTLYDDDGIDKSVTPPSDECDQDALVLNGIDKDQEVLSSSQILDGMGIDVIKNEVDSNDKTVVAETTETNKENEEAEEVKSSDLNDVELDLEETSTEKNKTDASKVRDTGDDLDTLLSKINDLVEDCIKKPKVGGAATKLVDEVVEIPDDDEMTDVSKCKETEMENNSQGSAEAKVKRSASVEKPPPESEKTLKETQMDIDEDLGDEIVCLDSPLPEESKLDEDVLMTEDDLLKEDVPEKSEIETEKPTENEGIPQTENNPTTVDHPQNNEEQAEEKEAAIEEAVESAENDDEQEVFLIDDDDDDDLIKNPEAAEESEQKPEEPKESEQYTEKEIEKALHDICKTPESEEATKAKIEKKGEDEDDDVVCLDDSDKEEETNNEKTKDKPADKATGVENENKESSAENKVEESTDKDKEGADNTQPEKSETEKAIAEIVKEKPANELAEKSVEAVPDDELALEDISKKPDEKVLDSAPKVPSELEKAQSPTKINQNDDIVILDDDEEEDVTAAQKDDKSPTSDSDKTSTATTSSEEEKKSAEDTSLAKGTITSDETPTVVKPSTIVSDNSDNARDGVDEKSGNKEEPKDAPKEKKTVPSNSNSNSSSSNLLKETTNQEHDEREQPPAKRIRLSQDEASSRHSAMSMDDTKSNIVDEDEGMEFKGDEDSKALKRVHSNDSLAPDFKKPKTDEIVTKDVKKDSTSKVEDVKQEEIKKDEHETKPYKLYPLPKFDSPPVDVSLDFLRRYKKKIHKMTRYDMEDFILQKIVEAIVDKSTFAEMREYIEKLEKNVASHRTKLAELTKQFRDLEMVHNRVLKDVETKNSQFIMPVKITRAVGLQVYFPNKKCDQPLAPPSPISTQTLPKNASVSTAVPEKSAAPASTTPVAPIAPIAPTTPNNSTQPTTVVNNAAAPPQRRGCVQKLTPMRPDTPRNSPLNRSTSATSQASPLAPVAKEPVSVVGAPVKILNRGVATNSRVNPPSNAMAMVNNIPKPTPVPTAVVVPATVPRPTGTPPGIATKKQLPARNRNSISVPHSQSDPNLVSQPLPPAATVVASQIPPSMTPKPANKSVIDLTDEDDVVPTPTPPLASPRTPVALAAPTPISAPMAANRGPYKVSVIPAQQLQQPRPNPPKQTPGRPPAKLPIIAPKPNGQIIPARQVPANPARYRHPAPLPNQPIHSSNPAWKQPPARPTIRISNLESGIVISWTIDDTAKEKYAESTSYQIYAYQETSGPPLVESWRHVGDVKAMLLPMAVTLTQFQEGQRYYFAVRAVDAHNRCGPFSFAKTWS